MTLRWLKILAAFGLCISETAIAQIVNPAEFAKAFNYPAEKLRVADITQQARDKHGEIIVLAFSISGEGRTFAPTTVVVARERSLLTEKMRNKLTQAMEASPVPPVGKPSVRKLQMPNGSIAYVGMGAFGPGGGEEMAIGSIPSHGVDVQVKVSVPYETPLDVTDATKAYHDALANADGFLTAAIEASMKAVVGQIAQGGPLVAAQTPANTTPPLVAAVATATPVPPSTPVASPAPTTSVAQTPAAVVERKSPVWPWVVGIAALIAILALVFKRRA